MKITVLGAGAIGNLVAGYLNLQGERVSLVGRPDTVNTIKDKGLEISGVRGNFEIKVDTSDRLIDKPDLLILAVKTQDIEQALNNNLKFLENTTILTTQNGIQADYIASKYLPPDNIISSIVMFGSTYLEPGKVVHNFEGNWIIGRIFCGNDDKVSAVGEVLSRAFPVSVSDNIKGMKYLKVFINANNCIPAILGTSMQEAFLDINISRISIGIWKEGLNIVNKADISLSSMPGFPVERVTKLVSLPIGAAAAIYSGIIVSLSKEPLYGSILQSIKRGRPSEIDYINGEFIRLAKEYDLCAPLNERLVEMVHAVEKTNKFFTKEELISQTKEIMIR